MSKSKISLPLVLSAQQTSVSVELIGDSIDPTHSTIQPYSSLVPSNANGSFQKISASTRRHPPKSKGRNR
jgi:hypothetical protein